MMTIVIGSDHAGYEMKEQVVDAVKKSGHAAPVAEEIAEHRDLGEEGHPRVRSVALVGEQAADNRRAMILDHHRGRRGTNCSGSTFDGKTPGFFRTSAVVSSCGRLCILDETTQ